MTTLLSSIIASQLAVEEEVMSSGHCIYSQVVVEVKGEKLLADLV